MAPRKRVESMPAPAPREVETLHWVGEPNRICGNCQHFQKITGNRHRHGLCHNLISGRLSTDCKTGFNEPACQRGFYPDEKRWPLAERLNGRWAT